MKPLTQRTQSDLFQLTSEYENGPTTLTTYISPPSTPTKEGERQISPKNGPHIPEGIVMDPRDLNTPDSWIPRHKELIRLTGKHPLNCEPPLPMLMQSFITPTPLHYVRNHGPVPKLHWDTHRVVVDGLVKEPLNLSMANVVQFPYREFPMTMVCAGNRRKEQNMIKQTIGFNWGSAACSTALWKGVPLCHVLKLAGVDLDEARYVCFLGADKLPNGSYGTSITIERAINSANDVLLAYEMNGEKLTPDHGYPVRVIIPGCIGGRMVKWLTKITVTNRESDNYYHFHDNRVLPPEYDAERANNEKIWYNPDYLINELNINSVITSPAHGERISLSSFVSTSEYIIKGYAYTGGGRKLTRVEVSLDDGKSWLLASLTCSEDSHPSVLNRSARKYWCWIFWSIPVSIIRLVRCKEIRVRAWDASQNTQPNDPTWNVTGMMNNCHFRVKVNAMEQEREITLTFEHPTQAGNNNGGWMVKPDTIVPVKTSTNVAISEKPQYSIEQVAKHDNANDAWIVVEKKVYDCTKFLKVHPGGADSILINAGADCTDEFNSIHSSKAHCMLDDYYIGDLFETVAPVNTTASTTKRSSITESSIALNPKIWLSCPLIQKKIISHDTRIFRFSLGTQNHKFGLPSGNHVLLRATVGGKPVIRAYTPITTPFDPPGYFDLLIKVYFCNVNPNFPDGGLMTQHLESLNIGDCIEVKGPIGSFVYYGQGRYQVKRGLTISLCNCRRMGMIAGGSGITPVFQIIQSVLHDANDLTELSLIYANRTEEDILLRKELDELARCEGKRLKVYYTVSEIPKKNKWIYGIGHVTEAMIRERLPSPDEDSKTIVLMCGPPQMLESTCIPVLKNLGFKESEYFAF
ncbi:537_t:CDS:2 [Acaulospora colombiana]|uniref:537_t:CDS:1 n=1 Tax=Acaulospora colombiana TaxID=27376 RepID=A0ACA9K7A5_9GLOM|nr:537_t:CDS:2 [Acaulospora colombiana]